MDSTRNSSEPTPWGGGAKIRVASVTRAGSGVVATVLALVFSVVSAAAQEQGESDLAKQSQNPIGNLVSLPLQNNTSFGIGPNDATL